MIFLILLNLLKGKNQIIEGICYAFSLLVKPIGLLWLPALFLKKHFKTIGLGLGLFVLASIPFLINSSGVYYFDNLLVRLQEPIGGPPGIFTLDALLRFLPLTRNYAFLIKAAAGLILLLIQWRLKPKLFISLFLWTSYYLLFYDLVFEYHYTTLAPFLALGVLSQEVFQNKLVKLLGLTFLLPSPFILFYLTQMGASGNSVTDMGWIIMVLFRAIPLIGINLIIVTQLLQNRQLNQALTAENKSG